MENILYPIIGGEKDLPIYITCIGRNNRQIDIIRDEGYHDNQLFFCEDGEGWVNFDDQHYIIKKGDVFFLPKDIPHEYHPAAETWEINWISFSGYATPLILNKLGLPSQIVFNVSNIQILKKYHSKMLSILTTEKVYGGFTASALLYSMLVELNKQKLEIGTSNNDSFSLILIPILNYIDEHFNEDITLEQLCLIGDVSAQHVCRVFKKCIGMRPLEYISKKRIQKSKELLVNTDESINQISMFVGYRDASYFSMLFNRYEGISPKDYRKLQKKSKI